MTTTKHHSSTIIETYKHRYRGIIFRQKTAAPFLIPSSSESEEDSSSIKENCHPSAAEGLPTVWGTTATQSEDIPMWRDEETRQADEDLLDFYQQVMDDMIQQAMRDIELGNY